MDPYKILNVPQGAPDSEIKKAFRSLAARHHPDKGGDEEQFKKINEDIAQDFSRISKIIFVKGPDINLAFLEIIVLKKDCVR